MEKLLILGAGQYGFAAKEVAEAMGCFDRVEFLDDHNPIAVGKLADIDTAQYTAAVVAIGNPVVREKWLQRIEKLATLVHPRAFISPSAVIGKGSIIEAGAVLSMGATIGKGTIVMANAVVGHNATVGDSCQLKYNCTVSENSTVPNHTKVDCNVVYRETDL